MKLKDVRVALPEASGITGQGLQLGGSGCVQHTGDERVQEYGERVELEVMGELRDEAGEEGREREMCSEECIQAQHEEVEVLSVLARAAKVQKRHSAVSARWDEGNLMRAMTQLRVGTVGWRYGQGAHQRR